MRILLVEDSPRVVDVITTALRTYGHDITTARAMNDARDYLGGSRFDLAIVDVGLPDGSGLDLCRWIRGTGLDLPVLMLTARNDVADRVAGLDAGADDYIGKPFATAELNARVRALGRRGPRWTESVRSFGELMIDRDQRIVRTVDAAEIALTTREFEIVALLAWADGRVIPRDDILETVWGDATEGAAASLEVLIARIRRKLGAAGANEAIRTFRNVGYAWALARSNPA